ncbi:hypothetical protein Tco_0462722 [Tanacetum coccineum]
MPCSYSCDNTNGRMLALQECLLISHRFGNKDIKEKVSSYDTCTLRLINEEKPLAIGFASERCLHGRDGDRSYGESEEG